MWALSSAAFEMAIVKKMERSVFDWILSSLRYLMSRWPVLIHDAIGITVAWLGAYWFRFRVLYQIASRG